MFSMRHYGFIRTYESVLRGLALRGHTVHIGADRSERLGWSTAAEQLASQHEKMSLGWSASARQEFWFELTRCIRVLLDYLRFLHPPYDRTPKLRIRAAEPVPPSLLALTRLPLLRTPRGLRLMARVLRAMEQ